MLAKTRSLEATQCVLEVPLRYKNVRKQNAQVRNDAAQTCLKIFLQLFPPNGKIGASGPSAQPHVAKDSKPGLVLALTRSLEATKSVLEVPPK